MIYPSANMLNGTPEKDYINEAEKKETRTTRQSQNAGILAALKDGAKITPMGALRRFGYLKE